MAADQPTADMPWYHRGLRFQCTGCGDCCTGDPGCVWVNKAEIEAMAAMLVCDVATFEQTYVRLIGIRKSLVEYVNGDCVFFDSVKRSCLVYEVRPRQCRTWPFWGSNVKSQDAWNDVCVTCPGAGKGTLVSLETIDQRVAQIRI